MLTSRSQVSRRQFLQTTAALAAPMIVPASALGRNRLAPSERVNVGVIGLGERGFQVAKEFLADARVQVLGVCDVHDLHYREREWNSGKHLERGREPGRRLVEAHYAAETLSGTYQGCKTYVDFREVCDRPDLDAIVVATPDHWHALAALTALQHGKDVYCEKPVTHYFAEGQRLVREVAERKAIFQVGSQQRSEPEFRQAVELVRNGHLGTIQRVDVGLNKGYEAPKNETTLTAPPTGLDYELWCGPAPMLPYMKARHHRWWRGNRAFGGGVVMDWMGHHNDIAAWALGVERSGPIHVEAVGWTRPQTDVYDTPVDYTIRCQYAGGAEVVISSAHTTGTKFIGANGWLFVNRGKLQASNPRWLKPDFDRGSWKAYFSPGHVANFVDGVRTRKECVAPVEIAHHSITPGHLGYVSHQLGRALQWDAATETIVDDAAAQKLLAAMPYRGPWTLG